MKRKGILGRGLMLFTFALTFACVCAGCAGKNSVVQEDKTDEEADDAGDEDGQTDKSSDTSSELDGTGIEGEWVMVYSLYHSEYGGGEEYDSCSMATDEYSPDSRIKIYKKDGRYIADYKFSGFEMNARYYGNELIYNKEPAYADCENKDWCFTFTDPFEDDEDGLDKKFTLIDDDTLIAASEYTDEGEDYTFYSVDSDVYIRSDDPRLKDPEQLRYFDTVTVSDTVGLLNSLQNNRKILLESGTYDLSEVDDLKMNNERVNMEYGAYKLNDLYNVCLEAKEGADVLIVVDDAYSPVLHFNMGGNVTLRGLTVGHNVEPGYCSGSVLQFTSVYGIDIEDCRLYGCGTYGVQAESCDGLNVKNCDIYECTYGLLELNGVYSARFTDCTFRDSKDMSMINLYSCSDIAFDDCKFENNRIKPEYDSVCYFVELSEYSDVTFNKCSFKDNQYKMFANNKVKMNNCNISDNGDLTNIETEEDADASELLRRYNEACETQKQTDLKIEAGNMDQASLNQLSYEEYTLWDTLLNDIWAYLKETQDEYTMELLTDDEIEWVNEKEETVKADGAGFDGGSMQPMIENGTAARLTRERVEYLLDNYVK